ncbi:anucleate primary sterigmata protein B [Histoplasma capsulatum H143]|uniref:Anucleate primary sterigmata protein B n=1 Tax=Ajellomyces capsulatus (strain H143) TaxID=544712 RepID=C6H920_AJECH|nr:anucleate primary sterigmata protein B [Histoplasma capsulatum H143]
MAASRSAPDLHSPPVLLGTNPSLMNKPPAAQKRRSSRVPGGFDTDDELSPMKMEFGDEVGTRDGKPELRGHQEYEERYQPWDDKEKNQPNSRLLREDDTNNNSDNRTKNDNSENVYDPFVLSSKDSPLQLSPRQRPQQEPMSLQSPKPFVPLRHPSLRIYDTMDDLTNTNDHNDDRDHAHEHKHGNNTQEHGQGDENEQDHIHGDENENSNENFNDQTLPNHTTLDEKEMRQKLLDMESSFLPEPSTIDVAATPGLPAPDDTYLIGVNDRSLSQVEEGDSRATPPSPTTPPGAYKTPAARRATRLEPSFFEEEGDSQKGEADHNRDRDNDNYDDSDLTPSAKGNDTTNISSLETISSSPTAAAAARTVSRAISTALSNSSLRSNASQRRQYGAQRDSQLSSTDDDNADATPRRSTRNISPTRAASRHLQDTTGVSGSEGDAPQDSSASSERRRKRPKFLTSRQSVHRFSNSSTATVGTDTASSEAAMGVDFAIQSGGAAPANNIGQRSHSHGRQKKMELSRSISLGSMASGVSGMSDDNLIEQRRGFSGVSDVSLHTLDEEDSTSQARPGSSGGKSAADPMTPKAQSRDQPPPETAITDHIKDIQIPATLARQFRESTLGMSPDKRGGAPTPAFGRSGKSLTLKEQSSTIDRLSKENFDLKMRIHFLNEALNKRSEEGVKEMISENVELKSDKIKLQKDNQALRRNIRDLEKQLRDRKAAGGGGGQEKSEREDGIEAEDEDGQGRENGGVDEEELTYLRERIETYEVEIERLRSESISRESEKRRLATMVKSLGDGRVTIGSDTGAREERDMWKDMLDAETAAREQAEEENRKLRDELLRMKPDAMSGSRSGGSRVGKLSVVSRSSASERDIDRSAGLGTTSSATLVELELLKQENAELRREVSAQTSMLTSRNREKERLYQEIEDLKLGQRRGDGGRSVAGDSIFERSVSRAQDRSNSHASDGVRSRASDAERESLEIKNGELRDHVSALKLENQSLRTQLDECMSDLVALDRAYQADVEQAEEDLQTMQLERDHALQIAEEREEALQDLKAEAQEELDAMGDELDQKIDECQRMEAELANQHENLKALQAEMRSASEGIIRLEEDAQSNLQKYKAVQQELDDANRELEQMEKSLFEANSKVQRLTVQQESSQNEIAFLREEQDGDKIKIGDLESELKTCQMSLLSEKDRTKELDSRLAEERHQRELQQELDSTALELESTRTKLDERESLLRNRDALLESHGLETRKLADLLERERQAHRADKHSFEQALKSHHQASRTISQNNSRISDLEAARNQDRKRFSTLEQQYKDQLSERNAMFLTIWKRLSAMCGPDWAHSNSLINGNLPSQEVIGNMLFWPGFSRNLLLALKTVETHIGGFKARIKSVERDLTKEYQNLEHSLNIRFKKLERMEELVQNLKSSQPQHRSTPPNSSSAEISKLRGENRLLKAELNLLQSHSRARAANAAAAGSGNAHSASGRSASNLAANTLSRYSSTTTVDNASTAGGQAHAHARQPSRSPSALSRGSSSNPQPSQYSSSSTLTNNPVGPAGTSSSTQVAQQQSRYQHLERRLTAEREARLLDRSGAHHEGEGSGDPDEGEMVIIDHRVSEGSGGYQRHDSEPYSGSYKGHKHSSAAKSTGREQSHLSHGHRQEHRRRGTGTGAGVGADEYDGGDDYEDDYDDEDDGNGTGTDDGEGGLTVEVEV